MYLLDINKLQPADIILIKTNDRLSAIMKEKTGCIFHHAMMYVGPGSYIHSDKGPGVQAGNSMRMLFQNIDDAVALRIKDEENRKYLFAIENFVRDKIGTEYSAEEAKRTISEQNIEDFEENRQFCTRLVAQAYAQSGLSIVSNPDYCTPLEILESEQLTVVKDVLRLANQDEIEHAQEESTPMKEQEDIQNSIFSFARSIIKKDIQNFDQLLNVILLHNQYDNEITNFIEKSGFLEMWKTERLKNLQNYEFEYFSKYYPQTHWKEVGQFYLKIGLKNRERYTLNFAGYANLSRTNNLRFIDIHVELYKNLLSQCQDMIDTANLAISLSNNQ